LGLSIQKYRIGAYLRISKRENEEHSLANQRKIINEYIKEHNSLEIYNYYEDNGYSGTSFDRPELKRMIKNITTGIINVVIIKDLSRLGRNYLRVGELLDGIFPLYDTKLISIGDNIDTINNDDDNYFYTAVLNILSHSYPQDISSKVKSTFRIKKINGNFIGASVPYGYLKDFSNIHKFIIDKKTSKIVKKIFNMFLSGKSCMQIANQLNKEEILPPRLYKIEKGIANYNISKTSNYWNSKTVKYILRNKTYIGDLIQGKLTRINYKICKASKEDWIIIQNHHKAIVSRDAFDKVQSILNNTSNRVNRSGKYDKLVWSAEPIK